MADQVLQGCWHGGPSSSGLVTWRTKFFRVADMADQVLQGWWHGGPTSSGLLTWRAKFFRVPDMADQVLQVTWQTQIFPWMSLVCLSLGDCASSLGQGPCRSSLYCSNFIKCLFEGGALWLLIDCWNGTVHHFQAYIDVQMYIDVLIQIFIDK